MEGITGYIYRNALHDFFGEGIQKYFTPFLVVHEKRAMSNKEINEILPENNKGINLVPQILADDADGFSRIDHALFEMGYREVNLNLGCPSRTVASKGRGSGFLSRVTALDEFLYSVYENRKCEISIKTRIGEKSTDEFDELMDIFNKYPVSELIIHPRIRYEYYKGKPHRDVFFKGVAESVNPVCYNGDVGSQADVDEILAGCKGINVGNDKVTSIMIGRGMIRNPALIRTLTGGQPYTREELKGFLTRLRLDYTGLFSGETPVLQKMKEVWGYMAGDFAGEQGDVRALLKCRSLAEYKMLESKLLNMLKY